ncbi:MAG: hypothetical protein DMD41_11175 [Gemmatimonadetes bacterium]|nr:MAG: hypothetical protein DMD41_11175 [Gemmatimonadota bacterium]
MLGELRGEPLLVLTRGTGEQVAGLPQLGRERDGVLHRQARRQRVARGARELRHPVGERPAARAGEGAERPRERVRAQLALRRAGRPLQRIGGLPQMLAVAHQLEPAQGRRARGRRAAPHDVRARIRIVQARDRDHFRRGVLEPDETGREGLELGGLGVGTAALGDLTRRLGDRAGGGLK